MQHPGRNGFQNFRTGGASAQLSGLDLYAWSEALREIPKGPVTEADFRAWLEGPLRRFFPFQRFFGAYGSIFGHRVQMHAMIARFFGAPWRVG